MLLRNDIVVDRGGTKTTLDPTRGPGNGYTATDPDPDLNDAVWHAPTLFPRHRTDRQIRSGRR